MAKSRPVQKRGGYSGSKVKTSIKVPKSSGASVTPKNTKKS